MEEAVEVRLHRDVEDFFAECSELVFRNLAQSQVLLGRVAKPTEVLSSPRALPTQSPLDQAQEAWVAEALSMVHPELTRMIMTAYGPQEVIEEAARALQKLRPATWGLEHRSFSSAFPVYQIFFFGKVTAKAISWNPKIEMVVTNMELLSPYPEVGDPPAGQMLRVLPVKEAPFQAVPTGLCNEVLLAEEAVVEKLTDYYVAFKQDSGLSDPKETRESHRQAIEDLVATCEVYVWQVGTDIAAISAAARALADVGRGITMVYTSPPHRRRGYAAALVTKIGAALTKQGLRTCINADARGSHGAERLYARIGFAKQGQVQQVRFFGPEPEPCA